MNYKSIILVGNGSSLLDEKNGDFIDSFDTVVRFNNFVIKGYEKHVGTKTNIVVLNKRFSSQPQVVCNNILNLHEVECFYMVSPNQKKRGYKFQTYGQEQFGINIPIKKINRKKKVLNQYRNTHKYCPTIGMFAICYLLSTSNHILNLIGFDAIQNSSEVLKRYISVQMDGILTEEFIFTKNHSYTIDKDTKEVKKMGYIHHPPSERKYLQPHIDSGRIVLN